MRNDQTLRPRYAVTMLFGLLFALAFGVTPASEARAAPVVTDPNTNFHRLYIVGSGDTPAENAALADDLNALKAALEKQGNHKSLNSLSATNPSLFQLKVYINSVKNNAQPGDAVTIYLSGRGNVDTFRLRTGVNVSASDLALMLTGFAPGVTRVVILDSCFGGSFADDLEATGSPNEIVVIGTSTTCPFDAPFDGLIQTFAEDLVEQAGQGLADTNHDGVVTGGELKTALPGLGWKLGEAGPFDAIMNGKSKCDGVCDLPMITAAPPQCAAVIAIDGSGFAASSNVALDVLNSTLTAVQHGNTVSDVGGGFTTTIAVPVRPSLVVAEDAAGNLDWHFCVSGPTPVPVDDAAPSCSLVLVGNVIKGTFQDLQSGLADIDVTSAWNVSVIIGPFTVGTTAPVMSEATIVNPMRRARVGYRLTDVAGHFTTCSKSVLRRTFSFSR